MSNVLSGNVSDTVVLKGNISGAGTLNGSVSGTGTIKGSLQGIIGKDGYSAYEVAVKNGFEGSEVEWLASLKGEPGEPGADGKNGKNGKDGYTPVKGVDYFDGQPGSNGKDGKDGKDGYTPVKGVDYFDGQPGKDGKDGKDGYTPVKGVDYFDGQPGKDGAAGSAGKDGMSASHVWHGTILTVTSASGTTSADLKGAKGDPGSAGSNGKDGTSVTVQSVSESTADGGKNTVTFSDGKTITVKNGSKGSAGKDGKDGNPGVYVGTGDMPSGYTLQINPNGSSDSFRNSIVAEVLAMVEASLQASANVRIGTVLLLSHGWNGSKSPYWQDVSIPTVTPNTQVDLTPSVEQLAIFHNKDLAFVTENDNGMVTVYAIGQKPTSDYEIQVTMTEVIA